MSREVLRTSRRQAGLAAVAMPMVRRDIEKLAHLIA